jgi:glutamate/tyrosine decarboxylase-like PLP-dependent enzyme
MRTVKIPEYSKARMLKKINKTDGCWIWTGEIGKNSGYGRFYINKRPYVAHRVVYDHFVGIKHDHTVIDHICRNRKCVNPDHLREVTQAVNAMENSEGLAVKLKEKTHCKHGHEFTPENTLITKRSVHGGEWRNCKECIKRIKRESAMRAYYRKKQKRANHR